MLHLDSILLILVPNCSVYNKPPGLVEIIVSDGQRRATILTNDCLTYQRSTPSFSLYVNTIVDNFAYLKIPNNTDHIFVYMKQQPKRTLQRGACVPNCQFMQ